MYYANWARCTYPDKSLEKYTFGQGRKYQRARIVRRSRLRVHKHGQAALIDKSRRELQIRVSLSFYVCDRGHPFAISQLIWIINRQAYCIPSTYLPRREKPRQNVSDKWYIAPIRKQNVFFLILINIRVLLGSLSALHFSLFQIYKEYFCIFGVL